MDPDRISVLRPLRVSRSLSSLRSLRLCAILLVMASGAGAQPIADGARREDERLTFQVYSPWSPRINLNADTAIVYGLDDSLPKRLSSWREHGYRTAVMTGVAW